MSMKTIRLIMNVRDLSNGKLHLKGMELELDDKRAQLWVETLHVAEYVKSDDNLVADVDEIEQEVRDDE